MTAGGGRTLERDYTTSGGYALVILLGLIQIIVGIPTLVMLGLTSSTPQAFIAASVGALLGATGVAYLARTAYSRPGVAIWTAIVLAIIPLFSAARAGWAVWGGDASWFELATPLPFILTSLATAAGAWWGCRVRAAKDRPSAAGS